MKDALLIIRDQLTMGYKLSFAEAMLLQQAIDVAVNQAGNSPVIPEGCKLMPLEMTDEIGEAIAMEANCCGGIALDIYNAALAAAPTPTK